MEPFAQFKNFGNLGSHKSVKSHLFGILETPGFKGEPSKSGTFLTGTDNNLNPDQGIFEIKSSLIRPHLSNGRAWNEYGKELPQSTLDKYPKFKQPYPLSKGTGSLTDTKRASNPETITGFGILPTYPEEERIKEMLNTPPKLGRESVFYKEKVAPKREEPVYEDYFSNHREKFTEEKFNRLARLGFSEDMIHEAIKEEAKRDIIKALNNPTFMVEVDITSKIEETYERWITSRRSGRTGENASGLGAASSVQNPGVVANSAAAAVASEAALPVRNGAQRILAEMRLPRENLHDFASPLAEVDVEGLIDVMGQGPGGETTTEIKATPKRGRGSHVKSEEEKEKIRQSKLATEARKREERVLLAKVIQEDRKRRNRMK